VSVVQNQTLSLDSDVETTHNVLDQQDGPAILVGHSCGGARRGGLSSEDESLGGEAREIVGRGASHRQRAIRVALVARDLPPSQSGGSKPALASAGGNSTSAVIRAERSPA
jgi:hypothetical protein